MKKLFLPIILCCYLGAVHAQVEQQVIAGTGAFGTGANGSVSYTVGEMTMVQTFTSANGIVTQGFQQPNDMEVGIIDPSANNFGSISLYPNPGNEETLLTYSFPEEGTVTVKLYNSLGQNIITLTPAAYTAGATVTPINTTALAPGMYLATLFWVSGQTAVEHTTSKKLQIIR